MTNLTCKQFKNCFLSKLVTAVFVAVMPLGSYALDSVYCPKKGGFISPGMTTDEVIKACGQPSMKESGSNKVSRRIPIEQYIYKAVNTGGRYQTITGLETGEKYPGQALTYQLWSLPSGAKGSLQVDVKNNKISAISYDGAEVNAFSECSNGSITVGGSANSVHSACGSPDMINKTFYTEPVQASENPEIWTYQISQYQSAIRLTFVGGKLQSIE